MAESLAAKYQALSELIGDINSVVTRIDERLEIFVDKLNNVERKIDHHVENCPVKLAFSDVAGRIKVLESKNGTSLKQEIKESVKDMLDHNRAFIDDIKESLNDLQKEVDAHQEDVQQMKLQAKDIDHISSGAANKWKIVGQVIFYGLVPLIYILLGALLLKWSHLQAPPGP